MTNRGILLTLALCLSACSVQCSLGGKKIDRKKLEALVQQLATNTALPAQSVRCPDDLPSKEGSTFECTVEMAGGSHVVVVTMRADLDANVAWKEPLIGGARLNGDIMAILADNGADEAGVTGVDCGDQILRAGVLVTCKPVGAPGRVEAKVENDKLLARYVPAEAPPPAPE